MEADQPLNRNSALEGVALDTPCHELDPSGSTAWLEETDQALRDCLARIGDVPLDAVPHHAVRHELLFLKNALRAARADLETFYLEAISRQRTEPGIRQLERSAEANRLPQTAI